MAITIKLDAIMSRYGIPLAELAEIVGITNVNLSRIRTGKAVSIRFSTSTPSSKGYGGAGSSIATWRTYSATARTRMRTLGRRHYISFPQDLRRKSNPIGEGRKKRLRAS